MNFKQLNLAQPLLDAVRDKQYTTPTPIQQQAIPVILDGRDVLGSAQTGTGKTAAFAIPILQLLNENPPRQRGSIRSLIVTPTRELAIQIQENLIDYGKYTKLRSAVIFGGVKQGKQVQELKRGVDILVATPGRLLDLNQQGYLDISRLEIFVLDEADRMLDMGFIHDVKRIIGLLPAKRQSLFFSATLPPNIIKLSGTILTKPKRIEVAPVSTTAETIDQFKYLTNKNQKKDLLLHLLDDYGWEQVLLFSRTKHGANRIARDLAKKKISAAAIHGDKSQNQRQKALQNFKDGKVRILVATDIAARGIDIEKLETVINYDIPNEPESYVHRIGRSGRAGETGQAISLVEPEELAYIRDIEKLTGVRITEVDDHPFPQTDKPMTAAEKAAFNKEKVRRRQEFFANRNKKRQGGGGSPNRNNRGGNNRGKKGGTSRGR